MEDDSFDSWAWFAFREALDTLSSRLAPRLFQITLGDGPVTLRLWLPPSPESNITRTVQSLDEVLPFLVDGAASSPGSPIRSIEGLLECARAAASADFHFDDLRQVASREAPARVAIVLRVRRQGLPTALGVDHVSFVDRPPAEDVRHRRGSLFSALVTVGLQLVDFDRQLELAKPHAPEPIRDTVQVTPTELLRRGAAVALERAARYAGAYDYFSANTLFHFIDELSKRAYERRGASGAIRFLRAEPTLLFRQPVRIRREMLTVARKALEMSDASEGRYLLCQDGKAFQGLLDDKLARESPKPLQPFVEVRFVGPHRWSCLLGERTLFRVTQGVPRPPAALLPRGVFDEWAASTFRTAERNEDRMWEVVEAALGAKHGALIVFCVSVSECVGLTLRQSFELDPREVHPRLLSGLVNIDGALVFDLNGKCHAAGVILDGLSVEGAADLAERRERGARFNSAVRFLANHRGRAGAVVVSEDSMVNLLPAPSEVDQPFRNDLEFLRQHEGPTGQGLRDFFSSLAGPETDTGG